MNVPPLTATCGCVLAAAVWGAVLAGAPASGHPAVRGPAPRVPRYAEGAPAGFSGGFGESSCHACHFDREVNAAPGRVTIDGVPERFTPGERYPLTITVTAPGLALGGFQLTARAKGAGAQAGSLAPGPNEETRVAITVQDGVEYAGQQHAGAMPTAMDAVRWTVVWTAPAAAGDVVFHVAANAADGDERASGDSVYTTSVQTQPSGR